MSETSTRAALARVIHLVDDWRGNAPFEVVIGWGSDHGVKVGDRFLVFGYGPRITDPETGEDLGVLEVVRGRGVVTHVQDRFATLRSTEKGRRHGATRRVVRQPAIGALSLGLRTGGVVEEEIPDDEERPFANTQIGDLAKPV